MSYERDGLGILLSHGVADGVTTLWAYRVVGAAGEANPIVRELLEIGVGFAFGSMLLVVGMVAAAYPLLARRYKFPRWFAAVLILVGFLVAAGNVLVVLLA